VRELGLGVFYGLQEVATVWMLPDVPCKSTTGKSSS